MKRWLFCACLLVFAAALLCPAAFADSDFTYELLEDGTARITGCRLDGDIVIPASVDGHTVTCLEEELFYNCHFVTSVTIPATVTYFGSDPYDNMWDYVFSYCWNLKAIHVASGNPSFCDVNGVLFSKDKTILYNYPCSREGSTFHVPSTTQDLCCTSFAYSGLDALYLDNPNTWWYTYTFYGTGNMTTYYLPGGNSERCANRDIEAGRSRESSSTYCRFAAFSGEDDSATLTLPDSILVIEDEAFANTGASRVVIPEGCATIRSRAFADCRNLRRVRLPSSLSYRASNAFDGCTNLTIEEQ